MGWPKRHPLVTYFVLTYAITWALAFPLVASVQGLLDIQVDPRWHFFVAFGPLLAAFITTGIIGGANGIKGLVKQMLQWRVGIKWALIAFSPAVLFVVSVAILHMWGGTWSDFGQFGRIREFPELGWLAGWVLFILTFGLGEETGWRGFALPRLQKQRSALSATLILSMLWMLWHLPVFFYKAGFIDMGIGVLGWAVSLVFGAIVLTWLYNSTRGSILMVILFHGTLNAASSGTKGEIATVVSIFIIFAAITIVRRLKPANLSHLAKQTA